MTSYYRGDTPDFIAAREVGGIHTPPAIEKFVLKNGKKYFYGMKWAEVVWTYDIKLALAVTKYEAEALISWLGGLGTVVTQVLISE